MVKHRRNQLYLSLVRSHLEYGSQVWDPHLSKDRCASEKVQKFSCKFTTSKWDSSYKELLCLMDLSLSRTDDSNQN